MKSVDARPYPYPFDPRHTAAVVIDMQRDFLEPGGFGAALGNDVSRLAAIVPAVGQLLHLCRTHQIALVHTREAHLPDLSDCPKSKRARGHLSPGIGDRGPLGRILVDGEPGSEIVPELAPLPGEYVLRKPGKGAFYGTELMAWLAARQITHLLVAGVTTEVCVQSTMREANDRGFDCLLLEDATQSYFAEFKEATLAMVRAQGGIVGWTATVSELRRALEAA